MVSKPPGGLLEFQVYTVDRCFLGGKRTYLDGAEIEMRKKNKSRKMKILNTKRNTCFDRSDTTRISTVDLQETSQNKVI